MRAAEPPFLIFRRKKPHLSVINRKEFLRVRPHAFPWGVAEHYVKAATVEHLGEFQAPMKKVEAGAQLVDDRRSLWVGAAGDRVPDIGGGWRTARPARSARSEKGC